VINICDELETDITRGILNLLRDSVEIIVHSTNNHNPNVELQAVSLYFCIILIVKSVDLSHVFYGYTKKSSIVSTTILIYNSSSSCLLGGVIIYAPSLSLSSHFFYTESDFFVAHIVCNQINANKMVECLK